MDIMERIIAYFKENEEVFNSCMEELDTYCGYLDDNRMYPMEELNELYANTEPLELLYRVFYGHDDNTWTTDASGNKEYGEFNPNRKYFYFNGYGNLVSCDYIDYSDYLDKHAIEAMQENRKWIDTIGDNDELAELFDILENGEDEEEEEEE